MVGVRAQQRRRLRFPCADDALRLQIPQRRWSCTRSHRARGLREDIELVLVARVMQGRITDRIPELECQRAGADARDLGGYNYVGVADAKHLVVTHHPRSEETKSEHQQLMLLT